MTFPKQPSKPNFFELQQVISAYWKNNHLFEKSVENRSPDKSFRFYDGPPFVTGIPHYGHIVAGTIKDVIPRYQTMRGFRVERLFGWDCHGIPIEQKVMSKHGIAVNRDIEEKIGIETFINECYDYTKSTSDLWEWYVENTGRWVDFQNSYKTMDCNYMESVWWVFKQLREKGYVYKGKKVFMYSTKLATPISNFEVAMDDTYGDVNDPAITVKFQLSDMLALGPNQLMTTYVLAWTTTPWTIPANLALAVNRSMTYDIVQIEGENFVYITATTRTELIFKNKKYQIIKQISGNDLEGKAYSAPFMYYEGYNPKDHHIYHADWVSDSDGTGIVHCAPEFGESDYQLGQSVGLTMTEALDKEGNYTAQVEGHDDEDDFSLVGKYYRDCNDQIIEELKKLGRLFDKASITHRVAFCPRTNVPLIYKAIDSWMIDIKKLKPKLLERNQDINRYPEHFKNGRFANSIESAPDWNISRSRYWGTPMPIYAAEGSTDDFMIIGSREELYELCKNGSNAIEIRRDVGLPRPNNDPSFERPIYRDTSANKELDMHRPWIDNHWFVKDGKTYKRINDVFDCWMESASMPYAQLHYPFENKEKFDNNFPGDFVVEYTGQIRAWFYVMHVIGVALFDKAPFKHVLTTGVLAGNDGRKMSKSYGNFVDPQQVIPQFGGEAIRMILANSPVSYGGDTALKDEYFLDMTKRFMLPVWNSFSFLTTYANLDNRTPSPELVAAIKADDWSKVTNDSTNILDRWIITLCKKLLDDVSKGLEEYSLVEASGALISFVDNLTNWYIRRSRRRFWKSEHDGDKNSAYQTLYIVMILFCKAAAPFVPFIADYIYKSLIDGMDTSTDHSIHLTNWPDLSHIALDQSLLDSVSITQAIVSGGLSARAQQNVRVRQPLATLTIDRQLSDEAINDIKDELNIKNVVTDPSIATLVTQIIKVNAKLVGAKLGGRVQEIIKKGKEGQFVLQADGTAQIDDVLLQANEFEINYLTGDRTDIFVTDGIVYSIDMTITPELEIEGLARDLIRSIQEQRKESGYELSDRIRISLSGADNIIAAHREMIQDETLSTITELVDGDLTKEYEIGGNTVTVMVLR